MGGWGGAANLLCHLSCPYPLQDVEWASVMKKSKQPIGLRCKGCVTALRTAWPFLPWDAIKASMEASEVFAGEVHDVLQRAKSDASERPFSLHDLQWEELQGYTLFRDYIMMPVEGFVSKFGVHPEKVGLQPEKISNERGEIQDAILIADEKEPYTRLRAFFSAHAAFQDHLQQHTNMLRPGQVVDYRTAYLQDRAKVQPKAMSKPSLAPTMSSLAPLVDKYKEQVAQLAAEREALQQMQPTPASSEPVQAKEEEQESSSADEIEDMVPDTPVLPSAAKKRTGKGKGKGQGKGHGTAHAKKKCNRPSLELIQARLSSLSSTFD